MESAKMTDGNDTASQSVHDYSSPSLLNGLLGQFDREEQRKWFENNWTISLGFVTAYVLFIYYGQEFMKNRKPFELKRVMTLWNVSLAIFSIAACTTVLPEFFNVLAGHRGFHQSVCASCTEVTDAAVYWGWLFTLSKIAELGDTVFLILRKRQLIFLHWYHHITVLLYCWYSYSDQISPARWFVCVNYFIHALMYSYYGLRAVGFRIPRWIAMTITTLQLSQMVIGVTVNLYAYRMKVKAVDCDVSLHHLNMGLTMYASYFFLFAHFFYRAYLLKEKRVNGGKDKNNNNKQQQMVANGIRKYAKLTKGN